MLKLMLAGLGPALLWATTAPADGPSADLKARFGADPNVQPKAADADSPLPEGYPGGTAPGSIEVKRYPAYRSAVARNPKANGMTGDMLFWPLFNHISKSNIEMTAPVINSYPEAMIETPSASGEITMEFLYRSTKQGQTGPGVGNVEVKDFPAADYVCLGVQGGMSSGKMRDGTQVLRDWLAEHKHEWVEDKDRPARRLGYHGPMTPMNRRLWEVQLPIKPAPKAAETNP